MPVFLSVSTSRRIWLPTGGGDGAALRSCVADPSVRVNLKVTWLLQPPAPPSPPSPPPPPPSPPSPPPSPPEIPFTLLDLSGPDVTTHARLRMASPTDNYAADTVIYWDGNSATDRDFVLLKFDLSSVAGYDVQKAVFHYTVYNEGNLAEMHEMKVDWNMNDVTYTNLPMPTGTWPFPSDAMDALWGPTVNDLPGGSGPHSVDVTASVQSWLGGAPNFGWCKATIEPPPPCHTRAMLIVSA